MNWKLIIIFIILVLFTIIIFVICNYLGNSSSNKNISTSLYLKNQKVDLSAKYYKLSSSNSDDIFTNVSTDKSLFFVYNPSIQWNKDGKITTIARVSGHSYISRLKKCVYNHFKDMKPDIIKGFSNYFNIFGKNKESSSGIVKFELDLSDRKKIDIPELINPFYTKNNIANNEDSLGFEDPRIFKYNDEDWIITSFRGKNFPFKSTVNTNKFGHYIILFPLNQSRSPLLLDYYPMRHPEKNWMPFQYKNKLYIVYSINPHVILDINMDTGLCKKIFSTTFPEIINNIGNDIGNGAPAQLIILDGIERYIGLGHTRGVQNGELTRKNFIYLFNKYPPFNITHVSKSFNLLTPFVNIEFGSGLLVDQKNNKIYISFGVDDCYSSIVTTTFEEIKNLLMFPNKKIKNPIDGSDMLWEESDFTRKNWPGLHYEIEEKKAIFNFAKNNNPDYGVIDVGAHIGDLSISLALALKNIGRDDVIVYAIDPSQEKCDFMKKMSIINSVSNIKILNYGLSDLKKILGHSENTNNDGNNTGGQRWDIKKEKINLTKTNEEESNIFIPADDLFKKGEIGLIGVYHIDVEGHEIDVLKGSKNLINTCKPILLIEDFIIGTQIKCKNKDECVTLFKTIEDINSSYKHTGFLPNGDLIFVPSE